VDSLALIPELLRYGIVVSRDALIAHRRVSAHITQQIEPMRKLFGVITPQSTVTGKKLQPIRAVGNRIMTRWGEFSVQRVVDVDKIDLVTPRQLLQLCLPHFKVAGEITDDKYAKTIVF
jgi:proline dehydrogenase